MRRLLVLCAIGALVIPAGCGDDDDNGGTTVSGVCVKDDAQGKFCITYTTIPSSGAAAVAAGCSSSWSGTWTEDGICPTGTPVGTCTLSGGATGGATSAVMVVYEPTDATVAKDDICGGDGTWVPAG